MTQCINTEIVYAIYKSDPPALTVEYCASGNKVNTIKNYMRKHGKGIYQVYMFIFNNNDIKSASDPAKRVEIGDPGENRFISGENFVREADRREKYYVDYMDIVYLLEELYPIDGVTI